MSLTDYSHVISVGYNCMPVKQLQRAARQLKLSPQRLKGPFDWLVAPLNAVIEACERNFERFFDPSSAKIVGTSGKFWKVWSLPGILAIHHFPREGEDQGISAASWRHFSEWWENRLHAYAEAIDDPYGNILILRTEDVYCADAPADLARLYAAMARHARARISVAAVNFSQPVSQLHPQVRSFSVEPTWPSYLPLPCVDWNFDYGAGVAWEGHPESWSRLWTMV